MLRDSLPFPDGRDMAEAFEDRDQAGIEGLSEVTPAHAAALRRRC